jgi:glycosyltransferase involved in cell wall biosynthesis
MTSDSERAPEVGKKPRVLMIGGEDVHRRIDLMSELRGEFDLHAAGSAREIERDFARQGFPFHYFAMRRGVSPLDDLATYRALRRIIRRVQPQIVHAFATKPCVWGRLAAAASSVPVIVGTVPGRGSIYGRSGIRGAMVKAAYQKLQSAACHRSDLTVFQNDSDEAEFLRLGIAPAGRTAVIASSGVPTDSFKQVRLSSGERERVRRDLGVAHGTIMVIMVSRVIRTKGVLDYAAASRMVRGDRSDVLFLLVGPDDQESLDRLSSEEIEELESSLEWLGERSDVPSLLAASDIFVLPSYYPEGVPRVLLEAAAIGLPLVTTDAPGCRDVLRPRHNGLQVPAKDPEAIRRAVSELADDTALRERLGVAARKTVRERFDLSIVAEATAGRYRELLGDNVEGQV